MVLARVFATPLTVIYPTGLMKDIQFYRPQISGASSTPENTTFVVPCAQPTACCTFSYSWTGITVVSPIPDGHPCQSLSFPWKSVVSGQVSVHLELPGSDGLFSAWWLRLYYGPWHWIACRNLAVKLNAGRQKLECMIELFI